jgi:hypothetical protein
MPGPGSIIDDFAQVGIGLEMPGAAVAVFALISLQAEEKQYGYGFRPIR